MHQSDHLVDGEERQFDGIGLCMPWLALELLPSKVCQAKVDLSLGVAYIAKIVSTLAGLAAASLTGLLPSEHDSALQS